MRQTVVKLVDRHSGSDIFFPIDVSYPPTVDLRYIAATRHSACRGKESFIHRFRSVDALPSSNLMSKRRFERLYLDAVDRRLFL